MRTYAHAYCTREVKHIFFSDKAGQTETQTKYGSCDVYVRAIKIKWRRSKRKSPRWTWILLSEGQTLPYYTKGTLRTKIRPSHVKIIVFRPLIWAVDRLY